MLESFLLPWAVVALLSCLVYRYLSRRDQLPLPPGPKPLAIVGNVKDFPPSDVPEFQHWLKHKDLYGPISSVTVLGRTLVLIHDKQVAHELLELIASKTSGRPTMIFANELCGYDKTVICQGYTNVFRRYRKLLHRELGTKATAAQFQRVQEAEMRRQLMRVLDEPDMWRQHFKTTTGATVLKIAYGYTVEPHKPDALVRLVDNMMAEFSLATVPMAWPVDTIPFLRYIPENFPGVTFKKTARKWRKTIQDAGWVPYGFVQRQMAAGSHKPSYMSRLVQQCQDDDTASLGREDEEAIVWSAASLYGAAADTTVITLSAFTLAMMQNPEVQRKAQEEIDRVIGTDRLPGFEDRDKLPYVNAVVKEALRWWPIAPMGFPHTADEDIVYSGYRIPKNSMILPAVWWFLHDPDVYADPDSFDPDRFLSPRNEPDPTSEAFGYGRRICPGRFFADSGLYLNIAQLLATFDIHEAVDSSGKAVGSNATPKPGILSYPTEFQLKMTPRGTAQVDLIRRLEKEYPWEASDAHLLKGDSN
ncbi:hypothetical protein ACHAQH_001618 [Verticillium albo-atrum]